MISLGSTGLLLILALTDSLSFGTLLVPVWLLMTPGRLRLSRILLYLGTVGSCYFLVGVALMAGFSFALTKWMEALSSTPAYVVQLTVGITLFALSFILDTKAARARATERATRQGRLSRWREQAMGESSAFFPLVAIAVAAVLIEVASMLPYLAATGIIVAEAPDQASALTVLAGYCLVMLVPALALTSARLFASHIIDGPLRRLESWLSRGARSTTMWIIGIAGFLLAADAFRELGSRLG
jgi:hypothetical protein